MGIDINRPPEGERFARSRVETGRYPDLSDVVRSGLEMPRAAKEQRAATSEAERHGFRIAQEIEKSVLDAIEEVERQA